MELKNVIKKIMESEDLKSRLRGLGSFDEVYGFFVANGYEESADELKEKLFGKFAKFSAVTDDDLSKVAGGVSGRQVLLACTGFMMLMGMSPFTNLRGYASTTPLHVAVKDGSLEDIKGSFEKNHDAINAEDENGLTPLHHAVKNKDLEKVKYLVENGADVNAPCLREWYNAYTSKNDEEWQRLYEEHPEQQNLDECGVTPLICAVENDDLDIAKYLIERGADINAQNIYKYSALFCALDKEHFNMDLVKYLVEHGADVNAKGGFRNRAPIHNAWKNKELMDYLIEHGADINAKDDYGWTPLTIAVKVGDVKLIKYLVEHGADINAKDNEVGNTPLSEAVNYKPKIKIVKYLVEHGADVNAKDDYGTTPLHRAVWGWSCLLLPLHDSEKYRECPEIVRYLVEHGADINAEYAGGVTPLFDAVYNDRGACIDIVKYLVEHGADVNAKFEEKGTPLHGARYMELAKYLVEHGADVNAKDKQGKTPLDKALESDNIDKAKYLVNHGAHSSDSEKDFVSLVWFGDVGAIDKAIENGANINECLSAAVFLGRTDLIDHLLEKGADINYCLYNAGLTGDEDLVNKLLEKEGADVMLAVCGAISANKIDFAKQLAEKYPKIELTDDKIKTIKEMLWEGASKEGFDAANWQESLEKMPKLISLFKTKK